ncbi:MAG: DUF5916 domain-containing protein [Pseudomonadales bacterium]
MRLHTLILTVLALTMGNALAMDGPEAMGPDTTLEAYLGADEVLQIHQAPARPEGFRLDGALSEDIWQSLPAYDQFKVVSPDTLADATYPTRIRFFYTPKGIYIGAEMIQPPDTLIGLLSGRDGQGLSRDSINITLDTSGNGRYGYWFGVNLGGALSDGYVVPERRFLNEWDGPWRGASKVTEFGWSAEMFIPWGIVSMPDGGDNRRMGFYLSRRVAHLGERWAWPPLPFTQSQFMSVLAPMNFETLKPRQQLDLYPFTTATADQLDDEVRLTTGADLFWRPSTNFQLNATINPDFGGVESDNADNNLTATETFFPEKRLFFQEGQQVFIASPRADTRGGGVGNRGAPYTMVNTRRIGGQAREPDNPLGATIQERDLVQPAELIGAMKATGQFGRLRYGLLTAFEKETKFDATIGSNDLNLHSDGSDYGILRMLYEDNDGGAYRGLGLLSTAVTHTDRDAFAHGVDWHYLTANGGFRVDGQLFMSSIDGEQDGYGGFVDFELIPRQGQFYRLGIEHMDEHVDINDLGFLQRNDRTRVRMSHTRINSSLGFAQNNEFDVRGFVERNSADLFLGGGIFFSNRLTLNNLTRITTRLNHFLPGFDDLNSFGNGAYRIDQRTGATVTVESPANRRFIVGLTAGFNEEQLGGTTENYAATLIWRPSDRLSARVDVNYDNRHGWLLHQEDRNFTTFDARQLRPKFSLAYFVSARQQLQLSWQWIAIKARESAFYRVPDQPGSLIRGAKPAGPSDDFAVSDMVFQARYRLELAPLSDLFLVYTRIADTSARLLDASFNDLASDAWNAPFANQLVLKLRYRFGS